MSATDKAAVNVLMAGVGGQGSLTASTLLGRAAARAHADTQHAQAGGAEYAATVTVGGRRRRSYCRHGPV